MMLSRRLPMPKSNPNLLCRKCPQASTVQQWGYRWRLRHREMETYKHRSSWPAGPWASGRRQRAASVGQSVFRSLPNRAWSAGRTFVHARPRGGQGKARRRLRDAHPQAGLGQVMDLEALHGAASFAARATLQHALAEGDPMRAQEVIVVCRLS